jgi:hypothetical protein
MKTLLHASGRARRAARWRVLAAVACALLLVLLAGQRVPCREAGARVLARSAALASRAAPAQERLQGDEAPVSEDAWSFTRSPVNPTRADSRLDLRPTLLVLDQAALAARVGALPVRAPATSPGRPADRPRITHCPAQGPPAAARV